MKKAILILLFFLTYIQAQDRNVTLVLPWKHQFQFAGYYMAKEMGFYKKAGLNVHIKEYDLKKNNTEAVATQNVDFGIGHSSLILDKLNNYPNIVLLTAIHQSSPLILLSRKRADITSLKDIANKKIMMSYDQTSTASVNAMLSSEHLPKDSYEVIETSFNPIDLINGNADLMMSYSSNEPFALTEKGIEYTIFDPKDYGYDFYSDILFTSSQMINNNPDTVKAFYTASMEGWEYAYKHIDKSVEIILKYYNTQSRSKKALIFEANTLKKLAFKDDIPFGDISQRKLKELVNTYRLLGLVDENKKIDFSSFTSNDFLNIQNKKTIIQKNENNLTILKSLYDEYHQYIKIFILLFLVSLVISLYSRHKVKSLLKQKTEELNKNLIIFDENIASCRTDVNGVMISVSKAFSKGSGYTKKELIGKKHNMLKSENTPKKVYKDLWLTISCGHTWRGEFNNIKKDGTSYWISALISPVYDGNNNIIAYDAIAHDITLEKVLEEFNKKLEKEVQERTVELEKLAITDKLTGIYNRLRLDEELSSNYNNYIRYDKIYSVILIDIDFFKKINDNFGHQVGDEVLQEISSIMKNCIRSTDILGRWGGEEFMIISPNTDIDGAYILSEHIRSNIEDAKFKDIDKVTISTGIAQINSSLDEKSIIKKADEALYRAKDNGRNRVEK